MSVRASPEENVRELGGIAVIVALLIEGGQGQVTFGLLRCVRCGITEKRIIVHTNVQRSLQTRASTGFGERIGSCCFFEYTADTRSVQRQEVIGSTAEAERFRVQGLFVRDLNSEA